MTTGGEVIKEFVVSIKYKVDDTELDDANKKIDVGVSSVGASLSKFNGVIGGFIAGSLSGLHGWATGVEGIIGATALVIGKTTEDFSKLYYQSQLMSVNFNSSVKDLMMLKVLGEQSGQDPETFIATMTKISASLRDLPKDSILNVATGGTKDPLQAIENAAAWYTKLSTTMQKYYAGAITSFTGLNSDQLLQLGKNLPDILKNVKQQQDVMSNLGFDPETMGADSAKFQRNIAQFDSIIEIMTDDVVSKLLPDLNSALVNLSSWIGSHSDQIKSVINQLPGVLETLFGWLSTFVNILTDTPGQAVNQITGKKPGTPEPSFLGGIWDLLTSPISVGNLMPWQVDNSKKTQDQNTQTDQDIKTFFNEGVKWLTGITQSPNVEIAAADQLWQKFIDWLDGDSGFSPYMQLTDANLTALMDGFNSALSGTANNGPVSANPPQSAGKTITTDQEKQNLATAIQFFEKNGFSQAQSEGIAARLFAESKLNPNAVNPQSGAYGIAQWLGTRQPAAYGTNGDLNSQLELVMKEFNSSESAAYNAIKNAKTPQDASNAMELYERAGDPNFTAYANSLAKIIDDMVKNNSLPQTIAPLSGPAGSQPIAPSNNTSSTYSPSTTVQISGNVGPEIGSKVEAAVFRAHARLYRNFQPQLT